MVHSSRNRRPEARNQEPRTVQVIRLTAGHQAKVEEKPEVRKAGGVYYTPTYIVDYIVKNTVGKLLEGKTPKQAEDLRILDPACGSGSFSLEARPETPPVACRP